MWFSTTILFLLVAGTIGRSNVKHRCGAKLREEISRVCAGKGFFGLHERDFSTIKTKKVQDLFFKSLTKKNHNGDVGTSLIVHECCLNPCGYSTLRQYCNDGPDDSGMGQETVDAVHWSASSESQTEVGRAEAGIVASVPRHIVAKLPDESAEEQVSRVSLPEGAVRGVEDVFSQNQNGEETHQPFGSFAYPGKPNFRYIWAVLYDDEDGNDYQQKRKKRQMK